MMTTSHTFPASAHDGEIVLPHEHVFRLSPQTIAEVSVMKISVVQSKAFSGKPDRPEEHLINTKVRQDEKRHALRIVAQAGLL